MGITNSRVDDTMQQSSNGGVLGLTAILDWLEFTFHSLSFRTIVEEVLELSLENFIHTGTGSYGYRDKYVLAQNHHISILANGTEQQGTHVILSGQGCQYLLTRLSVATLIHNVLRFDGQFSRVDLALDDRDSAWYTVPQLIQHARRSEIICKWREFSIDTGLSSRSSATTKEILYLGTARSDLSLRIYNKTLEQRKHLLDKDAIAALPPQWTRWEFVCRRRKAQAVILELLRRDFALDAVFADLLAGSMRIARANVTDSNRGRWATRKKWLNFVGQAQALRLTVPDLPNSIKRKTSWLQKQVMPTLAGLMQTKDGFARLLEMLAAAHEIIPVSLWAMVNEYNEQVKDDDSVRNVVTERYVEYVLELLRHCYLEMTAEQQQAQHVA